MQAPGVFARADAVALVVAVFRHVLGQLAPEIAVEVLLRRQDRAPWRGAAGAVVDRADDHGAGRILAGLQPVVAGGRPGPAHPGRAGGDAAAVPAARHGGPSAVGALANLRRSTSGL